jgi:hypothetical protein
MAVKRWQQQWNDGSGDVMYFGESERSIYGGDGWFHVR